MDSFFNSIKEAATKFSKINTPIRIISHLDTDGITSAAIMTKTLTNLEKVFSLSFVKQLSLEKLNELKNETYEAYLFLDLGSSNLKEIDEILKNRDIYILDHHLPQEYNHHFTEVNPYSHNIVDFKEISAAGITYLFSKSINSENQDLAHLAIIGAIGDSQETKEGFIGLNQGIFQDAADKIEVKTGLKMFNSQAKSLAETILTSVEPFLPGITGSEQGTKQFLSELEIDHKRKLIHLSDEELKKLVTAILIKRMGSEQSTTDVLGKIYLLKDSKIGDLKEFADILRSCGKLNKSSMGLGICLNDVSSIDEVMNLTSDYKKEIINALNWYVTNKSSSKIIETKGLTIINAEQNIKDKYIGTVNSIISRSNIYPEETILIFLAHTLEGDTKVSIRSVGNSPNLNLIEILSQITEKLGFLSGGHSVAAGSLIPQEKEQEFISAVLQALKKSTESFITATKSN